MNHSQWLSRSGLLITAVLSVAVIAASAVFFRGARIDLTQNDLYTLSDGTHNILSSLEEPVTLYFFYSEEAARGIPPITNYAQRVREMLEEMAEASSDKINLEIINPEPFSEEEDRATELGVQAVPLNAAGDNLYFGLAGTNALDTTESIPFFQPEREELLEYDLAKLVYQLGQSDKPVVGVMSSLPIMGSFDPRGGQQPGWMIIDHLRQFFDVRKVEEAATSIEEDIDLLMIVHPSKLPPETLYVIDQFVLSGGNALVFVDPYSEPAARMAAAGGMTAEPVSASSDLPELLNAWGLRLKPNEVLGDGRYALPVQVSQNAPPVYHLAMHGLDAEALDQDDVVTQGLDSVNVGVPGILEAIADSGLEFVPLLRSSTESMPIPANRIQPNLDPGLLHQGFIPSGVQYALAARVRGKAKSAFPDGAPVDGEDAEKAAAEEKAAHIAESGNDINVIVVADTDFLSDHLWVRVQNFLGQRIASPWAGNGDLVINAVDNLLGSSDLIGIRSRASFTRPFDRVEEIKREADAQFRSTEQELQDRLRETERKLSQLQSQKDDQSATILSAEQRDELEKFTQAKVDIRKQLRDVRHQLDRDIESLGFWVKAINIALIPLLLIVFSALLASARARRRSMAA